MPHNLPRRSFPLPSLRVCMCDCCDPDLSLCSLHISEVRDFVTTDEHEQRVVASLRSLTQRLVVDVRVARRQHHDQPARMRATHDPAILRLQLRQIESAVGGRRVGGGQQAHRREREGGVRQAERAREEREAGVVEQQQPTRHGEEEEEGTREGRPAGRGERRRVARQRTPGHSGTRGQWDTGRSGE